ncbi:tRNA1(Val) (adenine(37)-N6)-methyltransferase [Jiella marina]|uniref:tRNA1(Val) (adenine(37)-N6)-methyltransferase n=1 Tax=Jiella sp. LLJ827 TaxID=2917712 RepID=UPI0021013A8F|nr:methyltransferase [Jiella sp. LLJ827]MCQ0990448.1 methyltransferase [Jiella sp. LLJ827]
MEPGPATGEAGEGDPWPARVDSFHGGRFAVWQPDGWGYRSGLDAMLLAACLPTETTGHIADIGAGAGVVGLAAASRAANAEIMLVESRPEMACLAHRSLELHENAAIGRRVQVVEVDIGAKRDEREAAGLYDASIDLVLTNPPFHPRDHRRPADPSRNAALFGEGDVSLERWLDVSAALLRPRGRLAMICRADLLGEAIAAISRRLGDVRILPVHTRHGAPASRVLIAGRRGSQAPLSLLPGIDLQSPDGAQTALAEEISAGSATLPLLDSRPSRRA